MNVDRILLMNQVNVVESGARHVYPYNHIDVHVSHKSILCLRARLRVIYATIPYIHKTYLCT
jgi:hypothetical protein